MIIVDEFVLNSESKSKAINKLLEQGKKFVLMTHHPRSHYLEWQRYHKRHFPEMVNFINDYPNAPWLYLPKYHQPCKVRPCEASIENF